MSNAAEFDFVYALQPACNALHKHKSFKNASNAITYLVQFKI